MCAGEGMGRGPCGTDVKGLLGQWRRLAGKAPLVDGRLDCGRP